MKLSQNKENVFVKGLDNVDAQILTIVKRYFENNPEELLSSIDGIITEVLRRVKEDLLKGTLAVSVTSVNGKFGQVELNAQDVLAEPVINKNTAFNKDFGTIKDTICEGSDPRLSDSRTPLEHKHEDYIKKTELNSLIRTYLESKGMDFSETNVISFKNRDLVLENGTFIEV